MSGMLYLCATPIGNLDDMTFRAVEVLRTVDLIAAEDTRNSAKLLQRYQIRTPMTSYHEHNKIEKGRSLVNEMLAGKSVALITDAGTPAISDPGEELVRQCREADIPVTALPGPCACIAALALSGLDTRRFCFEGFLPMENKEREAVLSQLGQETRTILLYEAPHRLRRTLGELHRALGERELTICRELTKKFETVTPTTLSGAVSFYAEHEPRGEYVLAIEGKSREQRKREREELFSSLSVGQHIALYADRGMDRKEAMKQVAKDRGISKREVYQCLLQDAGK